MPIYQLGDWIPQIDPSAFVHETAVLIGQVSIGPNASVWPFATIRGDNEPISVGQDSNCQDGCTIADDCLIGIQAVILNGAVIGRGCLVGAASLITEGKQIAEGSLVLGSPGKVVRQLDAREIERSRAIAQSYVARGGRYKMALKRIG